MTDQAQSVSPSLYAALTSPITKTFAEQRKHFVHVPRGFSLDILPDFMMPVQNEPRSRSETEGDKTMETERKNMLGLTQLIVKDVIETSMPLDRTVTGQFVPLQHLFSILEQMFKHGFRPKPKGLLSSRMKDIWNVLESLETVCPESKEVTESCRNLSHIETPMGKVRAWIRLSLMQKKLPDYFKTLVDHRDILLLDCYESGAMLLNDESSVVAGLLVGLNFIDYNLCVKDEDLDRDFQIVSLLPYLKTRSQPVQEPPASDGEVGLKAILDQKNYLEELNAHLKYQLTNLESKSEALTSANATLTAELEDARKQINTAELQNQDLKLVNERIQKNVRDDISGERDASRSGFDALNPSGLQLKLDRELALKQDLERELKLQTNIRMETESAMRLTERDAQEKEELLTVLKKQLDDLKLINLEMYQKLQTAENTLKHKSDLVTRMEQKMKQMGDTMLQLGNKIQILESERRTVEETARKLSMQLAQTDVTRSVLETDLRIEQEQKANLMGSLTEQQNELQRLQGEMESIRNISQSYEQLRSEHDVLQHMSHEQEETLAELSTHLSEQKVKVAEMKEVTSQLDPTTTQWEKDAVNCKLCEKREKNVRTQIRIAFTVARRKHHCRHCGGTFCNPCSDNKMSLPSSPKPVRVCDNCHILLLRRYSTK